MAILKIFGIGAIIFLNWLLTVFYKSRYENEHEKELKICKYTLEILNEDKNEIIELNLKNRNIERELLARDEKYNKLLKENKKLKEELKENE